MGCNLSIQRYITWIRKVRKTQTDLKIKGKSEGGTWKTRKRKKIHQATIKSWRIRLFPKLATPIRIKRKTSIRKVKNYRGFKKVWEFGERKTNKRVKKKKEIRIEIGKRNW